MYENLDLVNIVTPVDADRLERLLVESWYDGEKTEFLVKGFHNGFSIGYDGEEDVCRTASNLQLHNGMETDLWNKVMEEVKLKRYAGLFSEIPFKNYIQSPIGLVPKDQGKNTRLIFHLSYPRNGLNKSVNANTPRELCKVKYRDFDQAIQLCMEEGIGCKISKSDMSAAFINLGILREYWKYLVMKARNPTDKLWYYFIDKCLPFGASISCAVFQKFSDAISHIVQYKTGKRNINYMDDFLFVALMAWLCNFQTKTFLQVCDFIHFPVALDKMFWVDTRLIFLGLLIDTINQMVLIPKEKLTKGQVLVETMLAQKSKKTTIKELQQLCGFLNFLGRVVVPGRAFTRRLYHYTKTNGKLKSHHHVKINQEMRLDLEMWNIFLHHHTALA